MKVLGLDFILVLLTVIFGIVGVNFLISPQFGIIQKILMSFAMFFFALGCSFFQEYLDRLERCEGQI